MYVHIYTPIQTHKDESMLIRMQSCSEYQDGNKKDGDIIEYRNSLEF